SGRFSPPPLPPFFFSCTPRPPSPTLFPYTTLFRSRRPFSHRDPRECQGHRDGRTACRAKVAARHGEGGRRAAAEGRLHGMARRRSEEHTSELQSPYDLVCRLLLEKKKETLLIHDDV